MLLGELRGGRTLFACCASSICDSKNGKEGDATNERISGTLPMDEVVQAWPTKDLLHGIDSILLYNIDTVLFSSGYAALATSTHVTKGGMSLFMYFHIILVHQVFVT